MIRNVSIAHIGSKRERAANAAAAMMWQPMILEKRRSESWDLDKMMTVGGMKLTLGNPEGKVID